MAIPAANTPFRARITDIFVRRGSLAIDDLPEPEASCTLPSSFSENVRYVTFALAAFPSEFHPATQKAIFSGVAPLRTRFREESRSDRNHNCNQRQIAVYFSSP
jgi:hypothetical protein